MSFRPLEWPGEADAQPGAGGHSVRALTSALVVVTVVAMVALPPSNSHFGSGRQFKGTGGAELTGRLDEAVRSLFHFVRDSQPSFEYPGPGCRPNLSSRAAA